MKVTITIKDNDDDTVTVNVEFDPPVNGNDMHPSSAMHLTNLAIEAMKGDNED